MSMSSHLQKRAIEFWKTDRKAEAHQIFKSLIHNDECNEAAWIWYIYTLETNPEKIAALKRFLLLFPGHAMARMALASLEEEARQEINLQKQEVIPHVTRVSIEEVRSGNKSRSNPLPWLLLVLGLFLLVFSSIMFAARYNLLQVEIERLESSNQFMSQNLARLNGEFQALQSAHTGLTDQYNSLVNDHNSLITEHSTLQKEYSTLNNEYGVLSGKYDTLSAEHASLVSSYDSLLATYNSTVQSYSAFKEIAIAPPYIYTKERNVHLVFRKLDGSLLEWMVGSDWLEYHLRRGDEQREKLSYDLSLYNDNTGETYRVVDDRKFVDPTPFENLVADLYRKSPNHAAFLREVWNIVTQLTAYTTEMGETPRFPMETLLSGGGDCEDHAILFASMILASPAPWEVNFIYMDSEHPTEPQDIDHVIVQVVTPDGPYLVEATSKYSINPYAGGVSGWSYTISRTDK